MGIPTQRAKHPSVHTYHKHLSQTCSTYMLHLWGKKIIWRSCCHMSTIVHCNLNARFIYHKWSGNSCVDICHTSFLLNQKGGTALLTLSIHPCKKYYLTSSINAFYQKSCTLYKSINWLLDLISIRHIF